MASGSPTIHSRIKAARSPMVHSRHFAEDSPRTRIELARNNLRMEKELKKIEKQAKTAALNLSNNQQAVRMSLRQLESKRNSDSSPLLTRSARFDKNESTVTKHKLGLFANSTSLTVASTADAYRDGATSFPAGGRARSRSISGHQLENSERPSAENGADADLEMIRTSSDEAVLDPDATAPQVNTYQRSPYISTPLNVRRVVRTKLPKPFHSLSASQHLPPTSQYHKQASPLSHSFHSIRNIDKSHNSSDLKLPPIPARTVISAHHNTTDKETLKKASELLGMSIVIDSTKSDGPTSFQQFYKDVGSNLIVVSPSETPCDERDDMELSYSDEEPVANDPVPNSVESSTSLSEQFEQIKKCRYIRHYYPNGERPPEAWH